MISIRLDSYRDMCISCRRRDEVLLAATSSTTGDELVMDSIVGRVL